MRFLYTCPRCFQLVKKNHQCKSIICNRCGKKNLFWERNSEGKWFLTNNGKVPHNCTPVPGVVCKYCGERSLFWIRKAERVHLVDRQGVDHICKK